MIGCRIVSIYVRRYKTFKFPHVYPMLSFTGLRATSKPNNVFSKQLNLFPLSFVKTLIMINICLNVSYATLGCQQSWNVTAQMSENYEKDLYNGCRK